MKKMIVVAMLFMAIVLPVFSEGEEVPIVLPNGVSAADDFSGSVIDSNRWQISGDWHKYSYIYKSYNSDKGYAQQAYDHNSGSLKSDYYRFETQVYAGNNVVRSVLGISDQPLGNPQLKIFIENDTSSSNYRHFTVRMGDASDEAIEINHNDYLYYYEIILERSGVSNYFDVTIHIKDRNRNILGTQTKNYVYLEGIYPTLYAPNNKYGIFYDYVAFKKSVIHDVNFNMFHQDGDTIIFDYLDESGNYDAIELYFSKDDDVRLDGSDEKITYDASKSIVLTDTMKTNGYFGIVGRRGTDYGAIDVVAFNYLKPPENFHYVPTGVDKRYKFTWDAVPGANSYRLVYQSEYMYTSNTTATNTTFDITDPSQMTIVAKAPSKILGNDDVSSTISATEGTLAAVSNFSGAIVKKTVEDDLKYFVDLSWNTYDGATEYVIVRNNGIGDYSQVASGLTTTTYSDPLTSQFLSVNYKIKTVVGGKQSAYSDVLTIRNKVKDVIYNFHDADGLVNLYWEPIEEATTYKAYVSKNEDMSEATIYSIDVGEVVDLVSLSYPFESDDDENRYVQIEAWKGEVHSDKTDVLTIDYSRNNMVRNLRHQYEGNTYQVKMSWDALDGASMYAVWMGSSPTEMSLKDTVATLDYVYKIKHDDPSTLYFSVQGVNADMSFAKSYPLVVPTFVEDHVKNLSANFDAATGKVALRWNPLFRADGYQLFKNGALLSVDNLVANTHSLEHVSLNDNITVRGYMKQDEDMYYSQTSNVVTLIDTESDIKITTAQPIDAKVYGSPMAFDLDFEIKRDAVRLYDVGVEILLKNLVAPGTDDMVASYVFPEIQNVMWIDGDQIYTPEFTTEIVSGHMVLGALNGDAGYTVRLKFLDDQSGYLKKGSVLRVGLKTDLRFDEKVPLLSSYAALELPFHIEEQISALETAYGTGYFDAGTQIETIISYQLEDKSDAEVYTKYQAIDFNFVDKPLIIGE